MKLAKKKRIGTGKKTYHMGAMFDAEFENQFHFSGRNYFDHGFRIFAIPFTNFEQKIILRGKWTSFSNSVRKITAMC